MAASFGRGAMTQHWGDIGNSDCVFIIGSNPAANHPISFKWINRAKDKGAKVICADPRNTRSAFQADVYAPIRSGTDIALIGSIINYALENDLVNKDYILTHTNAGFLVNPDFEFKDGLFGEIKGGKYTKEKWGFQKDDGGVIKKDPSLADPNCVYQILKRHYKRYMFDAVTNVTGTPVETLQKVAETYCATYETGKAGTIMYAMGTTQHTKGAQNIRSYAILQLLLGNIGVAGGGVNAMRGESNVQGSTDHGLLSGNLPGYLKVPASDWQNLETYLAKCAPVTKDPRSANWWSNYPKYIVSMLKAFYGDKASKENDFCYRYLPKVTGDYTHIALFEAMARGEIKGLIAMGQNPAVGGPNLKVARVALDNLDWLVAVDLWETETATFWNRKAMGQPGSPDPKDIMTEVFMLPAAASIEKEGSISNSGRWAQWRYTAVEAPGMAKSDLWILSGLMRELKKLYAGGGAFPGPIRDVRWEFGDGEEPDAHLAAKEINGVFLKDVDFPDRNVSFKKGDQVPGFAFLKDDGSTACGNWLYSGSYTNAGNMMAKREASKPEADPIGLHPNWSWCWPVNRRIIYNRASCNGKGEPYDKARPVVWYDWAENKWKGDVPDGPWPPLVKPDGSQNPDGRYSFIMMAEGHAGLFGDLADGPIPEHYEPIESPITNPMSPQQSNPMVTIWRRGEIGTAANYPIVATTFRSTEHWQAGAMTRNLPWLAELVPEPFTMISEELAAEKGISHGDIVTITSARAPEGIALRALVTKRMKPFKLSGKTVHQLGLIWHFGYAGYTCGASANELTPHVGDPNTQIPEYKAFLCDIRKGGRLSW